MSKKINIRISEDTLKAVCDVIHDITGTRLDDNQSVAIQECIVYAILTQMMAEKGKRQRTPQQTTEEVKRQRKKHRPQIHKSLRLDERAVVFLKEYYQTDNISQAVHSCIYDVIHQTAKTAELKPHNNLFYMLGQKNPEMQGFLKEIFKLIEKKYSSTAYAEPFAGTANVLLHKEKPEGCEKEYLNDNSADIINLLQVIQKFPYEFKLGCLAVNVCKECFDTFRKELSSPFSFKNSNEKCIERAVKFYFVRYASCRGKGESYHQKRVSRIQFLSKLDNIWNFSKRLHGVDIKKRDAVYFSEKILTNIEGRALVYFDAPYIGTEH
ncbi:MAG: DNA adenine methylase [Ruminococcus sp.]|nr:DNA adenine methylase [Ruminococcus sp.]